MGGGRHLHVNRRQVPGVPKRWVYTTNPIYLVLNPALTRMLSLGTLAPKIHRQKLEFRDNDCTYVLKGYTDAEQATLKETGRGRLESSYARIAEQITQSLKTNPEDLTGSVRGVLVLQDETAPVSWGSGKYQYVYIQRLATLSATGEPVAVRVPWSTGSRPFSTPRSY